MLMWQSETWLRISMFDNAAWTSFLYYIHHITLTSCAHDDTICLHHYKLTISSHFIRQVAVLFRHDKIFVFAKWHLFWHVGYLRHQQQVDLWPFDLESGVRVTCDMGYLCANFSLPRSLCSRVRPDVHNRQRCQTKTSLNASALWGRSHNNEWLSLSHGYTVTGQVGEQSFQSIYYTGSHNNQNAILYTCHRNCENQKGQHYTKYIRPVKILFY